MILTKLISSFIDRLQVLVWVLFCVFTYMVTVGDVVSVSEWCCLFGDYLRKFLFGFHLRVSKAVTLQALSGPQGSRKLRFPDYVTTAQDGGKVVSLTHRPPLPPVNTPGTHFC